MVTEQQIEILRQNLKDTNWSNVRVEGNALVADYSGDIIYENSKDSYSFYSGVNTFAIFPFAEILNNICTLKFDKTKYINKKTFINKHIKIQPCYTKK